MSLGRTRVFRSRSMISGRDHPLKSGDVVGQRDDSTNGENQRPEHEAILKTEALVQSVDLLFEILQSLSFVDQHWIHLLKASICWMSC